MSNKAIARQMARLQKSQWWMVAAAVCVGAMFVVCVYQPRSEAIDQLNRMAAQRRQQLDAEQSTARHLPEVEAEVARLRTRLAGLKQVPAHTDLGDFLGDIHKYSQQSLLQKLDVQPGVPRKADLYLEQPIALNFEGDFLGVFEFLRQIETSQRLTRIQSVSVHSIPSRPGAVKVEMSVSIYFHEA